MKKLIAIVLVALMLIPVVVYSCGVLPNNNADMCGEVFLAVQDSTGFLFGMLSPDERVSIAPMQTATAKIRGITAQGLNRAKGEMRYMLTDSGCVLGLKKGQASVAISPEYMDIVTGIVHRCMGEETEVTATSVIACTIRRTACTVTHMMVGRTSNKILVGTVLFCGAEMRANLYVTDWDADGQLDIVFSVNTGKATPTATPTAKPKPTNKPKTTPKPCKKPCFTIEINIEKIMINHLNIESIFPCGKVDGC